MVRFRSWTPSWVSSRETSFEACPLLAPIRRAAAAKLPVSSTATNIRSQSRRSIPGLVPFQLTPPTPGPGRALCQAAARRGSGARSSQGRAGPTGTMPVGLSALIE